MEDGSKTSLGRPDESQRSHTLPPASALPWGHRRSLSGGILSRLPSFLRSSSEEVTPVPTSNDQSDMSQHDTGERANAMVTALRQTKTRKRKGSLRKTALLGTGKMRLERHPSKLDPHRRDDQLRTPPSQDTSEYTSSGQSEVEGEIGSRRRFSYENSSRDSSVSKASWSLPAAVLSLDTDTATQRPHDALSPSSTVTSPVTSPNSQYASTTDDDDGLTFSAPNIAIATGLTRRRSSRSVHIKPLTLPAAPIVRQATEHDYSVTEWWGWIILLTTWIFFVVGMGSCLGVWSWAWDVGETPYAPPELEDDPTLPIVGYYPALIVMTGVMAWVWVVVAWVGMKYFRHARFVDGEE